MPIAEVKFAMVYLVPRERIDLGGSLGEKGRIETTVEEVTRSTKQNPNLVVQVKHQHVEIAYGDLHPDLKMIDSWPSKLSRELERKAIKAIEVGLAIADKSGKKGKKRKSGA